MSVESSIPPELARSVVRRWLGGDSPQKIVDWIDETNYRRKEPVKTSRQSVGRFIDHYCKVNAHKEGIEAKVPLIRRCRALAFDSLNALDNVRDSYRLCVADSHAAETKPEDRAKRADMLRSIGKCEMCLRRDLKLAGIDGKNVEVANTHAEEWAWKQDKEHRNEVFADMLEWGEFVEPDEVVKGEEIYQDPDPVEAENADENSVRVDASKPLESKQIEPDVRGSEVVRNTQPSPKEPGRNEPCPCRSGLKWKKCHGGPNAAAKAA